MRSLVELYELLSSEYGKGHTPVTICKTINQLCIIKKIISHKEQEALQAHFFRQYPTKKLHYTFYNKKEFNKHFKSMPWWKHPTINEARKIRRKFLTKLLSELKGKPELENIYL